MLQLLMQHLSPQLESQLLWALLQSLGLLMLSQLPLLMQLHLPLLLLLLQLM
jgi:hypothetical protein